MAHTQTDPMFQLGGNAFDQRSFYIRTMAMELFTYYTMHTRVFHCEDSAYTGQAINLNAFTTGDLVFMGGKKFLPVQLSP